MIRAEKASYRRLIRHENHHQKLRIAPAETPSWHFSCSFRHNKVDKKSNRVECKTEHKKRFAAGTLVENTYAKANNSGNHEQYF